jgi:hypothetical protein
MKAASIGLTEERLLKKNQPRSLLPSLLIEHFFLSGYPDSM